jgi:transposase
MAIADQLINRQFEHTGSNIDKRNLDNSSLLSLNAITVWFLNTQIQNFWKNRINVWLAS